MSSDSNPYDAPAGSSRAAGRPPQSAFPLLKIGVSAFLACSLLVALAIILMGMRAVAWPILH